MEQEEIHYIGILANADASLGKLKLKHGFEFQSKPTQEIQELISSFRSSGTERYSEQVGLLAGSTNGMIQVVTNTFHFWGNEEGYFADYDPQGPERDDAFLVADYLEPILRLMKLFKDGDPKIAVNIYYTIEDGIPSISGIDGALNRGFGEASYSLLDQEVQGLQALIDRTRLPFKRGFLNLAFDFYELSRTTRNLPLTFLSLMISLEVLFNPGGRGVGRKISEYASRLLANDKEAQKKVKDEIYEFYRKRSRLVHEGLYDTSSNYIRSVHDYYQTEVSTANSPNSSSSIIEFADLVRLRDYVRQAIIKGIEADKGKADFLRELS